MRNNLKKGFSLVEIMVVVVVMGVLAAVAVPKVFGMVERTNRKVDAANAVEMSNILKRAYETEVVKFSNSDEKNKLNPADMSLSVVVSNEGVNYYSGSGQVLVNNQTWENDKPNYGKNFGRVEKLFKDAGFVDVPLRAQLANGGWACYGAILFSDGTTRIFSSTDVSKCKSGNNHETMVKNAMNASANPIAAYLPVEYTK